MLPYQAKGSYPPQMVSFLWGLLPRGMLPYQAKGVTPTPDGFLEGDAFPTPRYLAEDASQREPWTFEEVSWRLSILLILLYTIYTK